MFTILNSFLPTWQNSNFTCNLPQFCHVGMFCVPVMKVLQSQARSFQFDPVLYFQFLSVTLSDECLKKYYDVP